ncbi:DUF5995 family protein [Corallococcus carmarthensis]|uniref:Uncharacterized protein n=1 Tax=Corallococcus carmarthensis TaxID=2316728 RepID=A0A3A8K562_9BACT|nr:DUF5995 family protein [Corallococcus carmarthensis]RKH02636.1 hypothetical protein D7X32_16355 [Corallococcus carmarthensis]
MTVSPATPSAHRKQRSQPVHLHETQDAQGPIQLDDVLWNPVDAEEALEGLEKILGRLNARNDSRAIFLDIYAIVTRRVVQLLKRPDAGGLLEPEWLDHLTGRFAEEALIAVRDSLKNLPLPTAAWRFATHYPAQRLTQPYQDALLGVSAHINHDLGMVVYDNIAHQSPPVDARRLARYRHDYFLVNEILRSCIPECLDLLAERYRCTSTKLLLLVPFSRPVVERAVMQMLIVWRQRVWENVVAMLEAQTPEEHQAVVERVRTTSGRIAQALCADKALWRTVLGKAPPFSLTLSPEEWPGVVVAPPATDADVSARAS